MTTLMDLNVDALLIEYHRTGNERAREAALIELMPLVRALAARYSGQLRGSGCSIFRVTYKRFVLD